ncbi:uncharacterized protein LAESUDRAFT_726146, partial [Laetiporus sulphureus 93-53]
MRETRSSSRTYRGPPPDAPLVPRQASDPGTARSPVDSQPPCSFETHPTKHTS